MNSARVYSMLYGRLCGVHPNLARWHSQWLAGSTLYAPLRAALSDVRGSVLDVGCGSKPYESWTPGATRYIGIDVTAGPAVDIVISRGQPWPLADDSFDAVLCTQVFEHASDLDHALSEIARVLRSGGEAIFTAPFIYNEHDARHDYRRFARRGLEDLVASKLRVRQTVLQGGVGSSLGVLFLNWVELTMSRTRPLLAIFMALLPLWIALSAAVNTAGWLLDRIDRTNAFYGNVMVRASKP